MEAHPKTVVVVLGMHRSGTSVITRGLEVLGVNLGGQLLPPVAGDNERGYWEDGDINALNIDLLNSFGQDWDTLASLAVEDFVHAPAMTGFKARAEALIRGKLSSTNCYGIKDPRLPRLLPFWKAVFDALSVQVGYVIAYRNPLSVARSLAARNGFSTDKSFFLWTEYMLQSLTHTATCRRVVVDYDRIMENPETQLGRIAERLGLLFPEKNQALTDYVSGFLDQSLRHARHQAEDLRLEKSALPLVSILNTLLVALASDEVSTERAELMSTVGELSAQWCEYEPICRSIHSLESKISGLKLQLADVESLNHALESRVDALESSVSWRITEPLRLVFERFPGFNARFIQLLGMPSRILRYFMHSGLREKAINSWARNWRVIFRRNRTVDLPHLPWLLNQLELNVRADHVAERLGRFLTRREEEESRFTLEQLSRREPQSSCRVMRAAKLDGKDEVIPVRRRILFVCGEFPNPVHGGGGRVADFIKALNADHDVFVGAWYDPSRDREAFAALSSSCRRLTRLTLEELEAGCVDKLLALIGGQPVDVVHYEWPRSLNSFDRRLGRHHIFTHMEVVCCSHWIDLQRLEPLSPDWLSRLAGLLVMLKVEILEAEKADAQIVVTAKDGEFLSRFAAHQSFYVVNHGISHAEFNLPEKPSELQTLVFTGNFIHPPNVDAVHWFMREIRPRILSSAPGLRVWFVGAHPPTAVRRYHDGAGVFVTGWVPDIRSYIQKAAVCIAPLVSGAGLRTKVVQYAALRRPCVATSIAVEDLGFMDGRDVFVADSAETFAERVIELLNNPGRASAMAVSARNRAMSVYDNQLIARDHLGRLYQWLDGHKEQP